MAQGENSWLFHSHTTAVRDLPPLPSWESNTSPPSQGWVISLSRYNTPGRSQEGASTWWKAQQQLLLSVVLLHETHRTRCKKNRSLFAPWWPFEWCLLVHKCTPGSWRSSPQDLQVHPVVSCNPCWRPIYELKDKGKQPMNTHWGKVPDPHYAKINMAIVRFHLLLNARCTS